MPLSSTCGQFFTHGRTPSALQLRRVPKTKVVFCTQL